MKNIFGIFTIMMFLVLTTSPVFAGKTSGGDSFPGGSDKGSGEGGIIGDVDISNHNHNNIHNNVHNTNKIRNTNNNTNNNNNKNTATANSQSTSGSLSVSGSSSAVENSGNSVSVSEGGEATSSLSQTIEGDNFSQTFEGTNVPRGFANGVEVNYPGLVPYFGPDTLNANMVDLEDLLTRKAVYTRENFQAMAEGADVEMKPVFFTKKLEKAVRDRKDRMIPVYLGEPTVRCEVVGVIPAVADDVETTSLGVLGKIGEVAMDYEGVDAIYIPAYAGEKAVNASGWGIGVNQTTSTMSASGDTGTVNSGGLGYSSGTSALKTKPWVHVLLIRYTP